MKLEVARDPAARQRYASAAAFCWLCWFACATSTALAQSECQNPAADWKSCVLSDGRINLEVNFRHPPLPSQLQYAEAQLRVANQIVCDATDGQLRLGHVTWTHGDGLQEDADVWWFAQPGRPVSGRGLSDGASHIDLYGFGQENSPCPRACDATLPAGRAQSCDADQDGTLDGCDRSLPALTTGSCDLDGDGDFDDCGDLRQRLASAALGSSVAHQLGHLVFELGDQYAESTRDGSGCGMGPGFDGDAYWSTRDAPLAMSAAERSSAGEARDSERNHSLMQWSGVQVCRDFTQQGLSYFDQYPDLARPTDYACLDDADCQFAANGGYDLGREFSCVPVTPLMSELDADHNHDVIAGTNFSAPLSISSCSDAYTTALPTRELVFSGRLQSGAAARCGNGQVEPGEECDPGIPAAPAQCSSAEEGSLSCGSEPRCMSNCLLDRSFQTAATRRCGNGRLDAPEACDPASPDPLPSCGAGRHGSVRCTNNCSLDHSGCGALEYALDTTSLQRALQSPGFTAATAEVYEGVGQVGDADSTRTLWAFSAPHSAHNAWTFVLAANGEEYAGHAHSCGDGEVDAARGEQCEAGQTAACSSLGAWGGGEATCVNCLWDKSGCAPLAAGSCGDGVRQPGEECDTAPGPSCAELGLAGERAPLACRDNCSLDLARCKTVQLVALAHYHVVFDPATDRVHEINGRAYPADRPSVELGSATVPAPFGALPDGRAAGQFAATGAFGTGRSARSVTLDFGELREVSELPRWGGRAQTQTYSLHGRFGTLADGREIPARGLCTDDFACQFGWNVDTQRFEASADTLAQLRAASEFGADAVAADPRAFVSGEWTRLSHVMNDTWRLPLHTYTGSERPHADIAPDRDCGAPTFSALDTQARPEVVLALDRSGSMSQEDTGHAAGKPRRLDFAKAAARAFIDLYADPARQDIEYPALGLMWFNHDALVSVGSPGHPRLLTRGNCGNTEVPCAQPNAIGHEYIKAEFLRDKSATRGEYPLPEGMTALGHALHQAGALFGAGRGEMQSLLLLSDGENNPPEGMEDRPTQAAQALFADPNKNLRLFALPAADADVKLHIELAQKSGGDVLAVDALDQLLPRFMAAFARIRGEALLVDRRAVAVQLRPSCAGAQCELPVADALPQFEEVALPVEAEARRLNVLLSTRNGAPLTSGLPNFELRDPQGELVQTQASSEVRNDAYYRIASVADPAPGQWTLRVAASHPSEAQYSYVSAHVENPKPDCFLRATPSILHDGGTLEVQALALWERPIHSGVTFTGSVVQPNKSGVPLSFAWDDTRKMHTARVPVSALSAGGGGYEVRVRCAVDADAQLLDGEDPYAQLPRAPTRAVRPFERAVSAFAHVESAQLTARKPGGDSDADGIPDARERKGDFDHDGLEEVWDNDSDNDDSPDSIDPDPFNADVPRAFGGQCSSDATQPPAISAPDVALTRCDEEPFEHVLTVSASDTSCVRPRHLPVRGQVISIAGEQPLLPIAVDGRDPRLWLMPGKTVIRWSADDQRKQGHTLDQTISVTVDPQAGTCRKNKSKRRKPKPPTAAVETSAAEAPARSG